MDVTARRIDRDEDWRDVAAQWRLREGVVYLNHGSFGPPPEPVRSARDRWQRQLDAQPMEMLVQRLEPDWIEARDSVADLVGADRDCLALVDNATYGMNVVAHSFPLQAGDEVLLTDHEYEAVRRIWERACGRAGATCRQARLPLPLSDPDQLVDAVLDQITPATRLLVISHITSPTALVLPVERIVAGAAGRGVATCVDGPHAVAQLPLDLRQLGCDFYTASCHKWLSAPLGTGFLYASAKWRERIEPPVLSWGRIPPAKPESWIDELMWLGTRSPAAMVSVGAAVEFMERVGWEAFRARSRWLARQAAARIDALFGMPPMATPADTWHAAMAHCQLPPGDALELQLSLREQHQIEVPVVAFDDRRWIRVSCHLYNTQADLDRLLDALRKLCL